jgi:hypothetical protein
MASANNAFESGARCSPCRKSDALLLAAQRGRWA